MHKELDVDPALIVQFRRSLCIVVLSFAHVEVAITSTLSLDQIQRVFTWCPHSFRFHPSSDHRLFVSTLKLHRLAQISP
jgi:hypothetical protein